LTFSERTRAKRKIRLISELTEPVSEEISLPISIREATISDLEEVYKIELECFADDSFPKRLLETFLTSPECVTLIAVSDGEPLGFIAGSVEKLNEEPAGHISTLNVKRGQRRKGIGRRLLDAFEVALTERGVRTCFLEVRANNIAARNLYLKQGYRPLQKLRNYYGIGADGLRLKKNLVA